MITVPKKRLRHAVDRVTVRRRVREAYRLNRLLFVGSDDDAKYDMAFIYVASVIEPYSVIERAVKKLAARVSANCRPHHPECKDNEDAAPSGD